MLQLRITSNLWHSVGSAKRWHSKRWLSVIRSLDTFQGGSLTIDIPPSFKFANIVVETKWQESCQLSHGFPSQLPCVVDGGNIRLSYDHSLPTSDSRLTIHAVIPEHFNVSVVAPQINLHFKNKLMGDISVECEGGDITIDKLKGPHLNFQTGSSNVTVKKVLEGNVSLACGALTAKMINGEYVSIESVDKVKIDAMYGTYTAVSCTSDLHIGLFRGQLQAEADGNISVRGVDGAINLSSNFGNIAVQVNSLITPSFPSVDGSDNTAETQVNQVVALQGNVLCDLDPEVKLSVQCQAAAATKDAKGGVNVHSDAFQVMPSPHSENSLHTNIENLVGYFTGESKLSSKRPSPSKLSGSSGKINLRGAERQSLHQRTTYANSQSSYNESIRAGNHNNAEHADREALAGTRSAATLCVLAPSGSVELRTISWIEAIRAKHGLA